MSKNTDKTVVCKHCGGSIIDRFDETVCVMCGRDAEHECDMCQYKVITKTASAGHARSRSLAAKKKKRSAV